MAASSTVLELLDAGSHIVAMHDLYGGTYRLFERVRKRSANLSTTFTDLSNPENFEKAITPNTKMLWVETPTNPLLQIVDLQAIAAIARKRGLISVCDNTFASPWIQRPIEVGFDIVVHSTTKYLNGHSDVIGGAAVIRKDDALKEKLGFLQNALGAVPSPFDAFLTLRGIKTLAVRMERHCGNAMHVAAFLEKHPKVARVIYPGLASHPQHLLAARQMNARYGGMVSAVIKGGLPAAKRFLERCRLFTLAESLGGVESLVEHPAIMTHASLPAEVPEKLKAHVAVLARTERNTDLETSARYIEGQFGSFTTQKFEVRGRTVRNIQSGAGPIVVGAHYDTVPGSPGADDNASAVAVLIELQKMLAPERLPVAFVAFVNEEMPYSFTPACAHLQSY